MLQDPGSSPWLSPVKDIILRSPVVQIGIEEPVNSLLYLCIACVKPCTIHIRRVQGSDVVGMMPNGVVDAIIDTVVDVIVVLRVNARVVRSIINGAACDLFCLFLVGGRIGN